MLQRYNIPVAGKHVVVLGRSTIVGKPMGLILLQNGIDATVTICHSKTANLKEITKQADILVAAIGRPCFVTADMVKPGAVVIDVGINRLDDGKLVGDVDYDKVLPLCGAITPVPGGVGPMTITMLLHNTILAAKLQSNS
jgi:methylenetetrahydrofolate dehydrogenase (NADP+)/methenyltetrahydrofolate cyclohydrolase